MLPHTIIMNKTASSKRLPRNPRYTQSVHPCKRKKFTADTSMCSSSHEMPRTTPAESNKLVLIQTPNAIMHNIKSSSHNVLSHIIIKTRTMKQPKKRNRNRDNNSNNNNANAVSKNYTLKKNTTTATAPGIIYDSNYKHNKYTSTRHSHWVAKMLPYANSHDTPSDTLQQENAEKTEEEEQEEEPTTKRAEQHELERWFPSEPVTNKTNFEKELYRFFMINQFQQHGFSFFQFPTLPGGRDVSSNTKEAYPKKPIVIKISPLPRTLYVSNI